MALLSYSNSIRRQFTGLKMIKRPKLFIWVVTISDMALDLTFIYEISATLIAILAVMVLVPLTNFHKG
jgi:hypothetical protein